jgi:hypothetical protein
VDYIQAIWKFVELKDDEHEGAVYRLPGFLPPTAAGSHALAINAHQELLDIKAVDKAKYDEEGASPSARSKSNEFRSRQRLVGWNIYTAIARQLIADPGADLSIPALSLQNRSHLVWSFKLIFPPLPDQALTECKTDADLKAVLAHRFSRNPKPARRQQGHRDTAPNSWRYKLRGSPLLHLSRKAMNQCWLSGHPCLPLNVRREVRVPGPAATLEGSTTGESDDEDDLSAEAQPSAGVNYAPTVPEPHPAPAVPRNAARKVRVSVVSSSKLAPTLRPKTPAVGEAASRATPGYPNVPVQTVVELSVQEVGEMLYYKLVGKYGEAQTRKLVGLLLANFELNELNKCSDDGVLLNKLSQQASEVLVNHSEPHSVSCEPTAQTAPAEAHKQQPSSAPQPARAAAHKARSFLEPQQVRGTVDKQLPEPAPRSTHAAVDKSQLLHDVDYEFDSAEETEPQQPATTISLKRQASGVVLPPSVDTALLASRNEKVLHKKGFAPVPGGTGRRTASAAPNRISSAHPYKNPEDPEMPPSEGWVRVAKSGRRCKRRNQCEAKAAAPTA